MLRGQLCALCGSPAGASCTECRDSGHAFSRAQSAVAYDKRVAKMLAAWKEGGVWALAEHAARLVTEVVARPEADVLVPVPADRGRTLWRGSDPAGALARALARRWDMRHHKPLARVKQIDAQKLLGARARRENVAGAFRVTRPVAVSVLVIDDVYTTGATVSAAAEALLEAGACDVSVVTFARAVRLRGEQPSRSPQTLR